MKRAYTAAFLGCLLGLCFVWGAREAFAENELVDAYKKEFAFLQAQKKALQERLKSLEKKMQQRVRQSKARVLQLQAQILRAQEKAGNLQQALQTTEQSKQKLDEQKEQLDKIIERGSLALQEGGLSLDAKSLQSMPKESLLLDIFRRAGVLMERQGQVLYEKGKFFLKDGTQSQGEIIHLGRIATFVVSDRFRGALAPAGAGRLKAWPQDAKSTASALLGRKNIQTLSLFLYENRDKEALWKEQQSLYAWLNSGGSIAWVIVWLGCAGALLLLMRLLILGWSTIRAEALLKEVEARVLVGDVSGALGVARSRRGPVARGLETALTHLGKPRAQVEEQLDECLLRESPKIERFGTAIGVTAAVAPLLGLLGTVTGMIATFNVLTEQGAGDPKALAGGISEALITTELGLIVAIPTLLIGTLLSGHAARLLSQTEWAGLHLLNTIQTRAAAPEAEDATYPEKDQGVFHTPNEIPSYKGKVFASS